MSILTTAKDIVELAKAAANFELQRKVVELQSEAIELLTEAQALRERVVELEKALSSDVVLTMDGDVMWAPGDPVPWCTACWEAKKLRLHLAKASGPLWKCHTCDSVYRPHPGLFEKHRDQQ